MRKVKTKDHEKLSDANIKHVAGLLEGEKPITKKAACEMLNITYNTTRLGKIIEEYKERKAHEAARREKNRGKPAQDFEIKDIIEGFLSGETVSEIAKRLYRSNVFVNSIIQRVGVPSRPLGDEKNSKSILPEECIAEEFGLGDIVWSAKYHTPAKIMAEFTPEYMADRPGLTPRNYLKEDGFRCYRIYVMERIENEVPLRWSRVTVGGFYDNAMAFDLGKLEHLKQYGINLEKL